MTSDRARRLLSWFADQRRDLPWRGPFPRDPYRVLVSEVMLQQTQVERVVPGFILFIERFPTVESLAAAAADEAVAAFSGMGYYGRARRLHEAARCVVGRGGWPEDAASLRALPGLGAYTSAAVAAFAFAGDEPPIDGNVARVAARLLALELALGSARLLREAASLARDLHAESPRPEVFEALIELGATVCTPRSPRCDACPLRPRCRGHATPGRFPLPRPARDAVDLTWSLVWLADGRGRVLLRRVPETSLLAGLWLPPFAAVEPGASPEATAADLAAANGHHGPLAPVRAVRHSITRHRIAVRPFVGVSSAGAVRERGYASRMTDPENPGLPTSSLLEKLRRSCTGALERSLADRWGSSPGLQES